MKVEKQEHYGVEVQANVVMDELRKDQCLCLNCELIENCDWAGELYSLCKENSLALAVTRCPFFEGGSS